MTTGRAGEAQAAGAFCEHLKCQQLCTRVYVNALLPGRDRQNVTALIGGNLSGTVGNAPDPYILSQSPKILIVTGCGCNGLAYHFARA